MAASLNFARETFRPSSHSANPAPHSRRVRKRRAQRFDIDADKEPDSSSSSSSPSATTSSGSPTIDIAADADDELAVPPPRPPGPRHVFTKPDSDCVFVPVKPWDGRGPPRPVINVDTDRRTCPRTSASSPSARLEQDEERRAQRQKGSAFRRGESANGNCMASAVEVQKGDKVSGAVVSRDSVCAVDVGRGVNYANGSAVLLGDINRRRQDTYGENSACPHAVATASAMRDQSPNVRAGKSLKRVQMDHFEVHNGVPSKRARFISALGGDGTEMDRQGALPSSKELKREVEREADLDYKSGARDTGETFTRPVHDEVIRCRQSGLELEANSANDLTGDLHLDMEELAPDSSIAASRDIEAASLLRRSEGPLPHPPISGTDSVCAPDEANDDKGIEESLGYDAQTFANHWRSAIIEEALVAYRVFVRALDRDVNHLCAPVDLPTLNKIMHFIGKELGANTRMKHAPSGIRVAYFRPRSSTVFPKSEETFCDIVSTIIDSVINTRFSCNEGAVRETITTEKNFVDTCSFDQTVNISSNGGECTADQKASLEPSKKCSLVSNPNSGDVQENKDGKVQDGKAWPPNEKVRMTIFATGLESEKNNKAGETTPKEVMADPDAQSGNAVSNALLLEETGEATAIDSIKLAPKTIPTETKVLHADSFSPYPSGVTLAASRPGGASKKAEGKGGPEVDFSFVSCKSKSSVPKAREATHECWNVTVFDTPHEFEARREGQDMDFNDRRTDYADAGKLNRLSKTRQSARVSGSDSLATLIDVNAVEDKNDNGNRKKKSRRFPDAQKTALPPRLKSKLSQDDFELSPKDFEKNMATEQSSLGDSSASLSQRQATIKVDGVGPPHEVPFAEEDDMRYIKNDKERLLAKLRSRRREKTTTKVANSTGGPRGCIRKFKGVEENRNERKVARTRQQAKEGQQREAQWEALKRIKREMNERRIFGGKRSRPYLPHRAEDDESGANVVRPKRHEEQRDGNLLKAEEPRKERRRSTRKR